MTKLSREEEIRNLRIQKIERLKEVGMEAYPDPAETEVEFNLAELNKNFSDWEKEGREIKIVGRIMSKRGAGKIAFSNVFDGSGNFQVVLQEDVLGKEKMKIYDKLFDVGDFGIFEGKLFVTQKGQESLKVEDFKMAGKSLLPLPDKWHGLKDTDERYRKRYLETSTNKEAFNRYILRSKVIKKIRENLGNEGFLEVETPILQNQASGAMAETFNTHHNDLDIDMVLRISLEAELKMITAGGYLGVYEIGKNFRNEGSDPTHIQEFTMLEWYMPYKGLEYNLKLTEKMIKDAVALTGKEKFKIKQKGGEEVEVDFSGEWPRVKFYDLLKEYADLDVESTDRSDWEKKALELGEKEEEIKKMSDGNLLDFIYKKTARKNIINPTFVMNYPGSLKPLAIQNEDGSAEVAQLVVAGAEITNQYAELVDPLKQRELLDEQAKAKAGGDAEAMDFNADFITAMEYGMPPMTGTGIGIDRLVQILTETDNIRETIFFPIMKPENDDLEDNAVSN